MLYQRSHPSSISIRPLASLSRIVLSSGMKENLITLAGFFCFSLQIAVIRFYKVPCEYIIYEACNTHGYVRGCVFLRIAEIRERKTMRDVASISFLGLYIVWDIILGRMRTRFLTGLRKLILSSNIYFVYIISCRNLVEFFSKETIAQIWNSRIIKSEAREQRRNQDQAKIFADVYRLCIKVITPIISL